MFSQIASERGNMQVYDLFFYLHALEDAKNM